MLLFHFFYSSGFSLTISHIYEAFCLVFFPLLSPHSSFKFLKSHFPAFMSFCFILWPIDFWVKWICMTIGLVLSTRCFWAQYWVYVRRQYPLFLQDPLVPVSRRVQHRRDGLYDPPYKCVNLMCKFIIHKLELSKS